MPVATRGTQNQKSSAPKVSFQKAALEFGGGRKWEGGIGTVIQSVYSPWHYPVKDDTGGGKKHILATLITIRSEDGEDHEQAYPAGFFNETDPQNMGRNAYPSKDGVYPAMPENMDLESYLELFARLAEGTAALSEDELPDYQGTSVVFMKVEGEDDRSKKLPKLDWAQLVEAICALPEFQAEDGSSTFPLTDESNCIVGYKFDFSWVRQNYQSKKNKAAGKKYEVLVPIASFGIDEEFQAEEKPTPVKGSKITASDVVKGKSKPAPTPPVEEEETEEQEIEEEQEETGTDDDLSSTVESMVYKILHGLGRPGTKKDFNSRVVNALPQDQRIEGLDLINDNKWLSSSDRPWTFKDGKFTV